VTAGNTVQLLRSLKKPPRPYWLRVVCSLLSNAYPDKGTFGAWNRQLQTSLVCSVLQRMELHCYIICRPTYSKCDGKLCISQLALYAHDAAVIATSWIPLLFIRYLETYLNRLKHLLRNLRMPSEAWRAPRWSLLRLRDAFKDPAQSTFSETRYSGSKQRDWCLTLTGYTDWGFSCFSSVVKQIPRHYWKGDTVPRVKYIFCHIIIWRILFRCRNPSQTDTGQELPES
jgi:hypothetical protein